MRDPDLVHQAERAAAALEEAWIRWRTRHGLATGALPPVSSYVGYSVEEPWGQPRVVFGIEAAEAARLAAILDEDAYAGLAPVDLTAVPERREPGTASPAWTVPSSAAGVPARALGPGKLAVRGSRPGDPAGPPSAPSDQPGGSRQRPGIPAEPGDSAGPGGSVEHGDSVQQPGGSAKQPDVAAGEPVASAGQPAALADKSSAPADQPAVAAGKSGLPLAWSSVLAEQFGRPTRSRAVPLQSGAQLPAGDQPPAGASSPAAASSWPPAVPDRPARRPLAVTPAAEQPAAPESGQFAAAEAAGDDVDYSQAEELTAEQPILPRALRRAAALADVPAELPDHEAAYLQELAARPGIVALRPRTAWPETEAAASAETAASPWPSVTYPGRPAPLLGQPAVARGATVAQGATTGQGTPGKDAAQREDSPAPGGLIPFAAGLGPSAVAGSARDAGPQPGAQPAPADGPSVTRLLPVSRLNRTRKPSETGPWPAVGDPAQTPTDTAV
jgi:hypothetical protein